MKHLFEDNRREMYTKEATNLGCEIQRAIEPIICKYHDMGFSARDISYVIQSEGFGICVDLLIRSSLPPKDNP